MKKKRPFFWFPKCFLEYVPTAGCWYCSWSEALPLSNLGSMSSFLKLGVHVLVIFLCHNSVFRNYWILILASHLILLDNVFTLDFADFLLNLIPLVASWFAGVSWTSFATYFGFEQHSHNIAGKEPFGIDWNNLSSVCVIDYVSTISTATSELFNSSCFYGSVLFICPSQSFLREGNYIWNALLLQIAVFPLLLNYFPPWLSICRYQERWSSRFTTSYTLC